MSEPIGACEAVIKSIKSTADGSFDITLSVNTDDVQIINKLISLFANNDKLINVGFATHDG
jgi:hypothetical protein